jgi:hypothetical protein
VTRLSKTLRFAILARDGFRCRYCGRGAPTVELHVDHYVSQARGGSDDATNLVASCADCNHGKSDGILIPADDGFRVDQTARAKRTKKWKAAVSAPRVDPDVHHLSTGDIDSLDEIDEDDQLALVWCIRHQKYEWHNLPRDLIGRTGTLIRRTKPGWRGAI